jgi:hypothetical protein
MLTMMALTYLLIESKANMQISIAIAAMCSVKILIVSYICANKDAVSFFGGILVTSVLFHAYLRHAYKNTTVFALLNMLDAGNVNISTKKKRSKEESNISDLM